MNKQLERLKLQVAAWLAAISATLGAIALILWLTSFFINVQVSIRNGAGTRYAILTVPNAIGWVTDRNEPPAFISMDGATQSAHATADIASPLHWFWQKPTHSTFGFGHTQDKNIVFFNEINAPMACNYTGHFAPGWLLVLLFMVSPILWFTAKQRRAYRYEHDLCIYCGSDMTTSPYRCPKCGREQPW